MPLKLNHIYQGDALSWLKTFPDESVHCVITSPPYFGLRAYDVEPMVFGGTEGCEHEWVEKSRYWDNRTASLIAKEGKADFGGKKDARGQIADVICSRCGAYFGHLGLEPRPDLFISHLTEIFHEVKRVLRSDGTCWIVISDSYAGGKGQSRQQDAEYQAARADISINKPHHQVAGPKQTRNLDDCANLRDAGIKPKDLCMVPFRLARALQIDGWYLRQILIWQKVNCLPESVQDRCTNSHEYILLLAKSGDTTFWTHRDGGGTRKKPEPDYRWIHKESGKEVSEEPPNWRASKKWRRVNLWRGHDYFYDAEAIREPSECLNLSSASYRAKGKSDSRVKDKLGGKPAFGDGGFWQPSPAGRNRRSVWTINTVPTKDLHFATFPPNLVSLCIKAGTSEVGCCPKCSAPMARVVKRGFIKHTGTTKSSYKTGTAANRLALLRQAARKSGGEYANENKTTGWSPTCTCSKNSSDVNKCGGSIDGTNATNPELSRLVDSKESAGLPATAPRTPALVLDPFLGSGTVALVARKLGRNFVGIELSPEYIKIAEKRLTQLYLF